MKLSGRARKSLNEVDHLLRRHPEVVKSRRQWVDDVVAWCHENQIDPGLRLNGRELHFDRELIKQINTTLLSQGQPPVGRSLSGLTSLEQAKEGVDEDKGNREGPRAHRVLVNAPADQPEWLGKASRVIHDVDWRGIRLDACDTLIQVENLDCFYHFDPKRLALEHCHKPLIVYRGDSQYGGAFRPLAEAWRTTRKAHYYAGDFDVQGVSLALSSGATALLVPPLEWLQHHATGFHDPAEQQPFRPALERHRNALPAAHPLQPYLAILLGSHRGLRQQWFETLVSVPLHQE
ncbi:hypothetical protein LG277_02500 [Vreelandella aquamarina]|uniref:DUF7281 domain-containing protein n=1 Tax=Vreelandella aquamarina TaxID=77097 RepID=UPI003850ECB8